MRLWEFPHTYELVYCFRKKPIMKLGSDGFFYEAGKARGVLVKRVDNYTTYLGDGSEAWYHYPEDYLDWKPHLSLNKVRISDTNHSEC